MAIVGTESKMRQTRQAGLVITGATLTAVMWAAWAYGHSGVETNETSDEKSKLVERQAGTHGQMHSEDKAKGHGQHQVRKHHYQHRAGEHSHWSTPPEAAARLNPVFADSSSIARGEAIFHYRCVACHGAGGRGNGPIAAALSPKPADLVTMVPHHPDGDLA